VQDGRRIRLRIHLLDKPGALAELTKLLASHRANIVDTLYDRAYYDVNLGDTAIDITLETRGKDQADELMQSLSNAGYNFSRVM
jgi:threonine dehydratase